MATACKGEVFTLSFDSLTTTGIGQTYQWEMALDSVGPYAAIPGDSNIIAKTSQIKTNWYRIATTCSSLTSFTTPVKVYTDSVGVPSTITIDTALAVSVTNYHSMSDLLAVMNCKGVSGPTTITYAPYHLTFNENLNFGKIGGTSATNTITVYGNGNTIASNVSPIVSFEGTEYVILDSLNIDGSAANVYGIHLSGASQHITIRDSKIDLGTTATSTAAIPVVVSGAKGSYTATGNNCQYLTLTNNEIIGGYFGVSIYGNAGPTGNYGHIISNNIIRDFYVYGLYMVFADSSVIERNDISRSNRTTVTTFYGIYNSSSKYLKIRENSIHAAGSGSYTAYPMYFSSLASDTMYESEIINNRIFDIQNNGTFYGIYALSTFTNCKMYHNTIQHEVPTGSTGTIRGIFCSGTPLNFDFRNNIIGISGAGSGTKTGIYINGSSSTIKSNNNVVNVNTGAGDNFGYWGGTRTTLLNWQSASSLDSNSSEMNPAFTDISIGNIIPISGNIDNIGVPLGVLTDFSGATRSLTTPDPGAYEFTGVASDMGIVSGELIRASNCYSFNDTVAITITNVIGSTIDFSINPINIDWSVTGPVNSSSVMAVFSGTLAPGNTLTLYDNNVSRYLPGNYTLHANIRINTINLLGINDTLAPANFEVKSLLSVTPKTVTVTGPADTVVLTAKSPLFPSGGAFFSEICHFKTGTGSPLAGWPTYLTADDYVEITGVANSDLAGYTMEEWSASAMTYSVTFPSGTVFSPTGSMIVAIGQLGASSPSPTSFYYHSGNTASHGSTAVNGYVLKNTTGTIMDAVAYGSLAFPAASTVTAGDWSGTTTASNSGIRLTAPDNNTSSSWANSSTAPQDPNVINTGLAAPLPGTLTGFDWNYLGSSFSTIPTVTVGPYTTPGIYTYLASYSNVCGLFYDTVVVTASATVPVKLTSFTATKNGDDVNLNWSTASEINNNHFEVEKSMNGIDFKAISTLKGKGTTTQASNYATNDEEAAKNTSSRNLYYRLKQVDHDGAFTYSRIAVVEMNNNKTSVLSTYPNPSNGNFNIKADLSSTQTLTVKAVNMMGATVWNKTLKPLSAGQQTINAQMWLPNGVYMLLLEQNGQTQKHKFVIEK
jgi:hypothetical protein